jgi:hypothetical protein
VLGSGLVGLDGFEDGLDGLGGAVGGGGVVLEEGGETLWTELLAAGVDGVGDAVGEEEDEVSGREVEGGFVVGGDGEETEGEAFDLERGDLAGVQHGRALVGGGRLGAGDQHGLDGAGVGDAKGAGAVIPEGDEHGDVLGVEAALLELGVEEGEEVRGGEMARGEGTQEAGDERGVEGGGGGLAGDVAEREQDAGGGAGDVGAGGWGRVELGAGADAIAEGGVKLGAVVEEVIDVAADGAGGVEADGDLGVGGGGGIGRHEAELDLARHFQVALHALFFLVNALVEARVGDGDGDLRGEGGEGAEMVFVVVVDAGVFEVDDADDAAFIDEGDGELGAGFRVFGDVARVLADIRGEDGAAVFGCGADEALAEEDVALALDTLTVLCAEAVLELFGGVVPEEDGEHLEVDDALEEGSDALEEVVWVEDAGDLAGDFVKDGEGLGLAGDAGVEAGVLDGDCHAGGGELKQALVVLGEEGGGFGLEVEDADDLVFDDEGDGELGEDVGVGVDVVFDLVDVRDEHGFALKGGLAGDAAAELDADALDFGGVAGLEAHPELVGAVVDEKDGEDAVVDDGADEVGDAVHEGVEVEGGVESVGEAEEEVELEGVDAGLRVHGVGMEEGAGGGVVAFEVMVGGGRGRGVKGLWGRFFSGGHWER